MMTRMFNKVYYNEIGASMVEYALLVVLIAIAALVATRVFGGTLGNTYSGISSSLVDARSGS